MKSYFVLSKKTLLLTVSLATLVSLIFLNVYAAANPYKNGDTINKHIEFAKSLNLEIEKRPTDKKTVCIPEKFGDVYENYNRLQQKAGYDLRDYKGCEVTLYSYKIENSEKVMNILVYRGRIIGGDISDVSISGDMLPLEKNNGKTET